MVALAAVRDRRATHDAARNRPYDAGTYQATSRERRRSRAALTRWLVLIGAVEEPAGEGREPVAGVLA